MSTVLAPRARPAAGAAPCLAGVRVSVDARYLARPGMGITVYLERAIGELLEAGAELTLLAAGEGEARNLADRYPRASARALRALSAFTWEQVQLARFLRAAQPDVHIAGANFGLPLVGAPSGTGLLLVVHDLIPLEMARSYMPGRPVWAARWLASTAIALRRADMIATPSETSARAVRRLVRSKPLRVAYPPLPADCSAGGDGLPGGVPARYLIYLGGYDRRKNVEPLLRAFAQVRREGEHIGLVLLGNLPPNVKRLLRDLGPDSGITAVGYVPEDEKLALTRGAWAVVHPSTTEGFGIPLVEAFACGVPVLSGVGGAMREVGADAPVYVDPADPRALVDGLRQIAALPDRPARIERGRMRLAALRRQSERRSIPAAVAALLDMR